LEVLDENFKISKEFKTLCYGVIYIYGGKIIEFGDYMQGCSFIGIHLEIFQQEISLVVSHETPHLAFSKTFPDRHWIGANLGDFQWIDIPELTDYFYPYFTVLSVAKLTETTKIRGNKKIGYHLENDFDYQGEQNWYSYCLKGWRPRYIWEVFFNYWY